MKKQLLLLILMLLPMGVSAETVKINGIYYNLRSKYKNAEVVKNPNQYSGAIVIPESFTHEGVTYTVTEIGNSAFKDCTGLTSVTFPNTIKAFESSAFEGCTGLTSITIPNSVEEIDIFVFYGCTSLTTITLGSGIKEISVETFGNCLALCDFYCYAENLPSIKAPSDLPYTDVFDSTPIQNATLHVLAASIDAYKAAEPWKNFKSIVALTGQETSVDNIVGKKEIISYHSLDGKPQSKLQKGVNIVRTSNGVSKKVVIK